jgi:hypothetical protein
MRKKEANQAAGFTEIIDCFRVSRLPEGPERTYEIKLDGIGWRLCEVLIERTFIHCGATS